MSHVRDGNKLTMCGFFVVTERKLKFLPVVDRKLKVEDGMIILDCVYS